MKHKVVLTGGSGFIGRHLINGLLRRDSETEIWCLSRRPPVGYAGNPRVRWVTADLLDPASYREVLRGSDDVYHLAAVLSARRKEEFRLANVRGTEALLQACREAGAPRRRFVHLSSIAAMGASRVGELLTETSPCSPDSEYGKSKRAAEEVVGYFASSVPVLTLRPSFVYGRGDLRGAKFLNSLAHAGPSFLTRVVRTVSVCHVSDLVQACLQAAREDVASGEIFIISDPEVYTWARIKQILGDVFERLRLIALRDQLRSLDPVSENQTAVPRGKNASLQYWGCDVRKAQRILDFHPQVPLGQGAWDTVRWHMEEGLLKAGDEIGPNAQRT